MSDQIQRDDGEWQMLLNNAYSMVESLTNRVEARDAQIESLEKFRYDAKVENAELHSQIESLQRKLSDWEMTPKGAQEIIQRQADRISELEAAALTPEMRERAIAILDWLEDRTTGDECPEPLQIFLRELLGEQG